MYILEVARLDVVLAQVGDHPLCMRNLLGWLETRLAQIT